MESQRNKNRKYEIGRLILLDFTNHNVPIVLLILFAMCL